MRPDFTTKTDFAVHPIISRFSSKNRRILILKDKSIGLIKWQKAGLENLLGSPCIKRRIRGRAIRNYQIGEYQNSPYSFNIAATNIHFNIGRVVEGYG